MADVLAGYLARIQADLPGLRVASALMNSDGMMNDVVIVNDTLVFRFAKSDHAKSLLTYEAQLLQLIERSVTVPVPHIEYCTDTYMHYRYVPGMPLYRHTFLRADTAMQDALAHQLATFLQQLHAIPLSEVPAPPWQTATPLASRQSFYEQRLTELEQHIYPLLWADQKAWVSDLFAPVCDGRVGLDDFTPVLIHRDLAAYHILHAPQTGHLTGVIDYGTAGAGDAALDWACLINTYGEQFVQRMHDVYPISQAMIDRARFLAGALELEWALGGIQSNDLSLLLVHLGRARDSLPMLTAWP
ncbi:MAG: phosphotransferase [Roseiflexaceae bacterium]